MDVRVAHRGRENLLRRGGVGDVDDDEPRRRVTDRIDAEERVELIVDALHFCRVHARIRECRRVSRDQLRLGRIRKTVDHYRAAQALRRNYEELSVVARLNIAQRGGAADDQRIDEQRLRAGNVPDFDSVSGGRPKPPRRRVRVIAAHINLGGVAFRDDSQVCRLIGVHEWTDCFVGPAGKRHQHRREQRALPIEDSRRVNHRVGIQVCGARHYMPSMSIPPILREGC